jgi:hypothetical protein
MSQILNDRRLRFSSERSILRALSNECRSITKKFQRPTLLTRLPVSHLVSHEMGVWLVAVVWRVARKKFLAVADPRCSEPSRSPCWARHRWRQSLLTGFRAKHSIVLDDSRAASSGSETTPTKLATSEVLNVINQGHQKSQLEGIGYRC